MAATPPSFSFRVNTMNDRPQPSRLSIGVAAIVILLLGMRIELFAQVTVGMILAIMLIPCWFPALRKYRGAHGIMLLGVAALGSGVLLYAASSSDHVTNVTLLVSQTSVMVELLVGAGVLIWARELMSDGWVAGLFGVGLLIGLSPDSSLFSSNPWKFGFSTGVTVIALALAHHTRKRWLELVVIASLVFVSARTDSRSSFAILALTFILVAWQLRTTRSIRGGTGLRFVFGLAAIGIVVYGVGQSLILNGYLGDSAQQRSISQIDASGSLIVGGRPELAATAALMAERPFGFGTGVVPSFADVTVAKHGMQGIGYQPDNNYVESYMFGDRFELHSVVGDLWAEFGLAGIVFTLALVGYSIRGLSYGIAHRTMSSVMIYFVIRGFWNMLFGPVYGSAILLLPLVGLVLIRQAEHHQTQSPRNSLARARRMS